MENKDFDTLQKIGENNGLKLICSPNLDDNDIMLLKNMANAHNLMIERLKNGK